MGDTDEVVHLLLAKLHLREPNGVRLLVIGKHSVLGVQNLLEQQHEKFLPDAASVFRLFPEKFNLNVCNEWNLFLRLNVEKMNRIRALTLRGFFNSVRFVCKSAPSVSYARLSRRTCRTRYWISAGTACNRNGFHWWTRVTASWTATFICIRWSVCNTCVLALASNTNE